MRGGRRVRRDAVVEEQGRVLGFVDG